MTGMQSDGVRPATGAGCHYRIILIVFQRGKALLFQSVGVVPTIHNEVTYSNI